jgi:prepilin-type N-terminal cleavage/methylation domain-containing protein
MARNERGLTLIEVLAAVVILSILILTFTNISSFTILSSSKSDKKAGAISLAERTMHSLQDRVNSSTTVMNINLLPSPALPPDLADSGYEITMSHSTLIANPSYNAAPYINNVSLQDIFILKDNSGNDINYLITITVSWAG